jgi:hypothetical protein
MRPWGLRPGKARQASRWPRPGFIHAFYERCISGDLMLSLWARQALYRRPPGNPNTD